MKMILVQGDDDYGAISFENSKTSAKVAYDKAMDSGGFYTCEEYRVKAYEFGDVDPKFIEFLRSNILDYDACKHTNFYVVD